MKKTMKTDVLIAGGGVAGLTLALLLAGASINVHVIDPHKPDSFKKTKPSGRTVALMQGSLNIIKAAGVWDMCEPIAAPLKTMRIIDDSASGLKPMEIDFEAGDLDLTEFGYNVPNNHLRAALFERAVKTKNITLHVPASLSDFEITGSGALATLESGKTIDAKLLVGADGRMSKTRELAGIASKTKHYDQAAVTCLINHSRSHDNVSCEFHRPAGPLALVPLPGNQSSVVWVETKARAEELKHMPKDEFERALQDATKNVLGGITVEGSHQSWPLCTIKAQKFTATRVALIAEAAHVMSPITAQGLNLSLRDVAALAETITDAMRAGIDAGSASVLTKYSKRRSLDIETRVFGVDGMNRLVSQDASAIKALRRTGLKAINTVPALKGFAMRHGLAPVLDEGRLAQGQSL